uniref:Protein SHQ1 homolog n=1 Tax=Meloidogyne hapla TaxID=6305 RepID=A0A1I8BS55_MELHA
MLTPLFQLQQNDIYLIVKIRAPYCKLSDAEVTYGDREFVFNATPYFLRLFLTGYVIDDETGTCEYDSEKGEFSIFVPKKCRGEFFPRLEMLSELIKPQQQQIPNAKQPIEIINSTKNKSKIETNEGECEGNSSQSSEDEEEDSLINDESLFAKQKLCCPTDNVLIENNKFGYGFGWLRNEVLGKFKEEIADLIDLDDPENILIEERSQKLKEFDEKHFSEQYYLADLFSQEQYQNEAMEFCLDKKYLILNQEDCSDLKDLRIRKLEKFTKEINEKIALSLVDIIFGFAYDFRTTLGEHSVESGWTISKLSPSLTFLVKWSNMQEAMSSTIRHSLVLPMIRNWELSLKVLQDVQTIIENGCSSILHVLLTTRRIFNRSGEFRYLLNQLFIDDLCLWIQSIDEELILNLNKEFKNVLIKINKSDILELDLEFIEAQAKLQILKPVDSDDDE